MNYIECKALLLIVTVVLYSTVIITGCSFDFLHAYSQTDVSKSKLSDGFSIQDFKTQIVRVGDIDMAFKMFGKGEPILLINGFGNTLDHWHPLFLEKLAKNHTVIVFDNRGVGNTTFGEKKFTIKQFAHDTNEFLEALNVTRAHVLGFSMGGRIAQELALSNPEKIDKLIIYATACSGTDQDPATPEVLKILSDKELTADKIREKLRAELYPKGFDFSTLPKSQEIILDKTIELQREAITEWPGVCKQLSDIDKDTLVIVGTEDNLALPSNSLQIATEIPGAWLVQIKNAGHPLEMQFPEKYSNIILVFLES